MVEDISIRIQKDYHYYNGGFGLGHLQFSSSQAELWPTTSGSDYIRNIIITSFI